MKTESILKELTDMTNRIEEIKKQIEKPEFEVGKWYKDISNESIFCLTEYNGIGKKCNTYGFDFAGNWMNEAKDSYKRIFGASTVDNTIPATYTEVQESLKKEAVKNYPIGTKYLSTDTKTSQKVKGEFTVYKNDSGYYMTDGWGGIVFQNGTWAEIQKTMTIDEIVNDIHSCTNKGTIRNLLIDNKTQIIETLNSI